jgi:N-methylhydantoinase B
VQGGKPGAPPQFWRNPDTDRAENLGNTDVVTLDPGDVIRIVCSGGSGWGPAWRRPVEAVLADLAAGKITAEAAMRDYGVVPGDAAATAARRAELAAAPQRAFDAGPERDAYEQVWTEANYAALTEILALLPVHWRHYAKRRIFALVEADPDRRGDGSEVRAAFAALLAEFPQIAH